MTGEWTGCPLADSAGRKGFDPAPFQGVELLVNGVSISLEDATAYSIPEGWVDRAVLDENGQVQTTDDGRWILYERLEGRVEFRPKQA